MDRRNNDKIRNNSYKNADNLKGEDYEFSSELQIDEIGVNVFMKDTYNFDSILYNNMIDSLSELISTNKRLDELTVFNWVNSSDVDDDVSIIKSKENRKYSKDELNEVFEIIYNHFKRDKNIREFLKISYIFDIVCNITQTAHSSLFDVLDYYNKILILSEFSNEFGSDSDILDDNNFIH